MIVDGAAPAAAIVLVYVEVVVVLLVKVVGSIDFVAIL